MIDFGKKNVSTIPPFRTMTRGKRCALRECAIPIALSVIQTLGLWLLMLASALDDHDVGTLSDSERRATADRASVVAVAACVRWLVVARAVRLSGRVRKTEVWRVAWREVPLMVLKTSALGARAPYPFYCETSLPVFFAAACACALCAATVLRGATWRRSLEVSTLLGGSSWLTHECSLHWTHSLLARFVLFIFPAAVCGAPAYASFMWTLVSV